MPFRTLFREICGFVCTRFTSPEFVNFAAQTMNDSFCRPTASAIILHASSTTPMPDTTPSFVWSYLIAMFWCVVLSLVYLMSFPNRLSTTLAAALERSRAEALGKELSAVKIASENLSLKHQLALDELNTRLKQTVEAHDLDTQNVLRDAVEKHAKSTKTLVDGNQTKVAAMEEACKKEIEKMCAFYEKHRQTFELKNTGKVSDLRLQMSIDTMRNKKATAAFKQTIKESENRLEQAAEEIELLEKEQLQIEKDADRLRRNIEGQKKSSTAKLADKDYTINDLAQKLQRTQKKLNDIITDALSQESVDEKDWNFLEQKISKLKREAEMASRELRGSEEHVRILTNQLRDSYDLYNAANSEAERQTKAARTYATRATLKRARMRKAITKRPHHIRSSPKVEGQVTAPKAANIEDDSNRATINMQVTVQKIADLEMAQSLKAMQLKRITSNLKTVEAELLICRESSKTAHKTATQDLEAAKASLLLSKSELKMLRTSLDKERTEHLGTQNELGEVKQKLDRCGQHSGHLQAQLEAVRQNLDQERSNNLQVRMQASGLEQGLQECREHGEVLKRQLEESRNATSAATTRVSDVTLALTRANDQLQHKEDEKLALQEQLAEYAVNPSNSNHAPEEAMELDPALFEEAQTALPLLNTDTPTFSQALGFLALVNFELQQQQDEAISYPEPPEIPAPFLFDPSLMSLNEFNATPRPQGVASLPYFSPHSRISAATLEGSSRTEESRVQATAPPLNALPPSTVREWSVDMIPNALDTSSSILSTSISEDPLLSLVQQGKRREDPPAKVEGEGSSAAEAMPEGVEEEEHLKKRPAGQSGSDEIDPSHEIFNGGYTSSDFDDDNGSTISSVHASEFADWESRQYEFDASKDDDGQSGKSGDIELEPGDFDNCYSDIESEQGAADKHNGEGSNTRTTDTNKEFADFVQGMKTQLVDDEVNAKIEAVKLKKIDDELKVRARRAGPGPSSRDTAPAERRVIAPKSKKNRCE
ncbi:Myosin N-terminal SH3-like domain [Xylographa soralifera]|nr:Myosin N-terminal SH3-like domain [Xylographa soralifera]